MPLANNNLLQNGSDWVIGAVPSQVGTGSRGVSNPYGAGASAYEPHTQVYDPSSDPLFRGAESQLGGSPPADTTQAASGGATAITQGAGSPTTNGSVLSFVNAAKTLLGKPYVWGGTTANGVDCSGLLYYAFNKAGIKMPRYRAVDYGKMGQQVDAGQALPGDIVYWNEPGNVDHVGIYLGSGMVLNSPHTGTVVQINKVWGNPTYRRIIGDNGFGQLATPSGAPVLSYDGDFAGRLFLSQTPATTSPPAWAASAALGGVNADSGFKNRAL